MDGTDARIEERAAAKSHEAVAQFDRRDVTRDGSPRLRRRRHIERAAVDLHDVGQTDRPRDIQTVVECVVADLERIGKVSISDRRTVEAACIEILNARKIDVLDRTLFKSADADIARRLVQRDVGERRRLIEGMGIDIHDAGKIDARPRPRLRTGSGHW